MNKKKIYNLIILDESGSMESIKHPTISGFNEVVQTIKGAKESHPEQEHFISLVTFNSDGIKTKLYNVPVSELEEINGKIYQPNAMTPLFDAIGMSATRLHYDLSEETDTHVLVTILTDGLENASKEYTAAQIKQLIDKLQAKGWTFTYIGANHDVAQVATSISINNYMVFESTHQGSAKMWERERSARKSYLDKLSRNEDVQRDYFDDKPEGV